MEHRAIEQVIQRAENDKSDSDFTYFFSLLLAGEALAKTVILGMTSAITDDKDRNRYRLEHSLVRSDGLGDWGRVIEDVLSGPASQYLLTEVRTEQAELTKLCRDGDWQYTSVVALKSALASLEIASEEVPIKSDMKRWFRLFVTLRNKTRAHGATHVAKAGKAAEHLERSISLFYQNFALFHRPWAYLYRNLSGKYRVSSITPVCAPFEFLKKDGTCSFPNGVYIFFDKPRLVPLLHSNAELQDFFFSNGGLSGKRFELLSYFTNDKIDGDATAYNTPPGTLPPSETEGHGELLPKGNCFSNVPDLIRDYISRPKLEEELLKLLLDDRRPIITLVGRGGIGKTSLSLKVIQNLYEMSRYDAVVWLSARDVDLQLTGPKPVRPLVLSTEDMSKFYADLVLPPEKTKENGFNARSYFEKQLQKSDIGPCLFVFDNFETTQNPIEMFNWIDSFIRLPNKALITTRLRDFKGDYPLEVLGMESAEATALIDQTATHLGVKNLLNGAYITDLISISAGHPYVIKILLGEVAKAGRLVDIKHIVATSDEILVALFERTYASLTPCSQRAFMTLADWNSSVPRLALEAVLLRSIEERSEVEKGIESLLQFSMAEVHISPTDNQEFISLPFVARIFGKKKLNVSPFKTAVKVDVETLQMLGTSRRDDIHLGLEQRLKRFIENISIRIEAGGSFESYAPILEMICRSYNPGWLLLARWHMESNTTAGYQKAKEEARRFLENKPTDEDSPEAWKILAQACQLTNDPLGEIHAFIERAKISSVPFYDISNTANRLNRLLHARTLDMDKEEKRLLAQSISSVLEKRRQEAGADDLSRMAWLAFHLDREDKAREYAEAGLRMDADNYHCSNILSRLTD